MASFEDASTLIAGMISFNGLIPIFGITGSDGSSETEIGIMTIPSYNNWLARLNDSSYKNTGPTGAWAGEWWSIYNYLQYGGICVVGSTGSTGAYFVQNGVLDPLATPLHNVNLVNIDVVFDGGNANSSIAAASIANTRTDCLAFLGNNKLMDIPTGSGYTFHGRDFGVTAGSQYVCYFAGRKNSINDVSVPSSAVLIKTSPGSDAAGCLARTFRTNNKWTSPAGTTRGRILSALALEQTIDESESSSLLLGGVNPITPINNSGFALMGNKTSYTGTEALKNIHTLNLIIFLKKELKNILDNYLFEQNNEETRLNISNSVKPILNNILSSGGILSYGVVCDSVNNTDTIISQGKLIIDLTIKQSVTAETIVINFIIDASI